MQVKTKPNEITITRVYNAPVKVVWDAWADPEKAGQWWGPRGFTINTHSKDLRAGGHWKYTMFGPDGVTYNNTSNYFEVDEYSKMVYDHGGNDEQKPLFRVTVIFTETNGKTTMDITMALPTPEAAEQTKKFIKKAGGDSTWDRLAEYLEKSSTGTDKFVINRSFNAPIDLLFDIWTSPEHIKKWLAPTGFEMDFVRADIKEGGSTFYYMTGPQDMKMYGRAEYQTIEKPKRIVYTQQFCDENEKISRHPMAPTWPETMLTTVEFAEEAGNQTRITITWECFGKTTKEELETFVKSKAGMTQGWTGSFDKLEAYLAKI